MPTMPSPRTARLPFPRTLAAALLLLTALAAAFAFSPPAQAQDGTEFSYVDLVMLYEHNDAGVVTYKVQNNGTETATGSDRVSSARRP